MNCLSRSTGRAASFTLTARLCVQNRRVEAEIPTDLFVERDSDDDLCWRLILDLMMVILGRVWRAASSKGRDHDIGGGSLATGAYCSHFDTLLGWSGWSGIPKKCGRRWSRVFEAVDYPIYGRTRVRIVGVPVENADRRVNT